MLSIVEEIKQGSILRFDPHAVPRPSILQHIEERKKLALSENETNDTTRPGYLWARAGEIVIVTRDHTARSADELSVRVGDELTVTKSVPGNVWWHVKNSKFSLSLQCCYLTFVILIIVDLHRGA